MQNTIPSFIKDFSCFYLRIRFRANDIINFSQPWYFEPRFAIGTALKNSKHPHLFQQLFRPLPQEVEPGKLVNPPSALVIRVASPNKRTFKQGDFLDVYITLIGNQDQVLDEFCQVVLDFQNFHFFKKHHFKFISHQIYDPTTKSFQQKEKNKSYQLNFNYFTNNLIQWKSVLSLHFTTPTRVQVNELFTEHIPYNTLVNRLSRRLHELTKYHLNSPSLPYISEQQESLRLSQLNLPQQAVFKDNKKYELSGFLGWLHYQVKYDLTEDYLWAIAPFVHVGNFTQMGNGHLKARATTRSFYDQIINKAHQSQDFKNITEKEERLLQLKDFSYAPQSYKVIKIPKSNGAYRSLSIANPNDLLLQKFATEVLYQEFGHQFIPQNYAYRKGKGAADAIRKVQKWKNEMGNTHYVIRCDIDNFFDKIPINLLLSRVQKQLNDPFFMHFISLWLKSGLIDNKNEYELNQLGIPQGSALSPILANIFLHQLDQYIRHHTTENFIRYADDILLLVPNTKDPLQILQELSAHLKKNFHLALNKEFYVGDLQDAFHFLGITFSGASGKAMHTDKLNRLPQKIKHALNLYLAKPTKIEETIAGLKNYYGKLLPEAELERIDDVLKRTYQKFLKQHPESYQTLKDFLNSQAFLTEKHRDIAWNQIIESQETQKKIKIITPKTVEEKLRKQKQKHLKEFAASHELVVTQTGTFIGTSKGKFVVKHKGKVIQKLPAKKVRQISILCDGVSTSSNLVKICHKNNIHIVYYDHLGNAYAATRTVESVKPELMQQQANLTQEKQILFMQRLVKNKVKNQLKCIKYYAKYYKDKPIGETLQHSIQKIKAEIKTLPSIENETIEQYREKLFLWEARCAATYWKAFGALVGHHKHSFEKREYRGTENMVNQMLNYGYAILESKVMRTIHIWQLNPAISYFHTSAQGQNGLCFDLMEQYRAAVVDKSVLALIGKKEKVSQNDNGLLHLETRKKIIAKINEKLFALQEHKGEEKTVYEIMQWQTGQFRKFVEGKNRLPKFYNALW